MAIPHTVFIYRTTFVDGSERFLTTPKRDIRLAQALATIANPGIEITAIAFFKEVQEAL